MASLLPHARDALPLPARAALRCALIRGGTSKGVFVSRAELDRGLSCTGLALDELVRRVVAGTSAVGGDAYSPVPGLGSGNSSTSKFVVVGERPATSGDAGPRLAYDFAQVMPDSSVDWRGTCGNLATGVSVFAELERLVRAPVSEASMWAASAAQEIRLRAVREAVSMPGVDGLPGRAFRVEFVGQARGLASCLPTGNVVDDLLAGERATLFLGANPTVFVRGRCRDWAASDVERLRAAAARRMGIELLGDLRVSFCDPPAPADAADVDLVASITTPGRLRHHAFTSTGLANLSAAARIPGTVPHSCVPESAARADRGLRVRHPSGVVHVDAAVARDPVSGAFRVESVSMVRTARLLMYGWASLE